MFLTAYLLTNCILIALTALFMQDTFFLLLRIVSIAEIKFTCIYTHTLPQCIQFLCRRIRFFVTLLSIEYALCYYGNKLYSILFVMKQGRFLRMDSNIHVRQPPPPLPPTLIFKWDSKVLKIIFQNTLT